MSTLHIDLTINDEDAFRRSFAEHTEVRRGAGVLQERVSRVAGERGRLQIELDFAAAPEAEAFLTILEERIWKESTVLVGTPEGRILEPLDLAVVG